MSKVGSRKDLGTRRRRAHYTPPRAVPLGTAGARGYDMCMSGSSATGCSDGSVAGAECSAGSSFD